MRIEDVNKALISLEKQGLMKRNDDGTWEPTALGRAAVIIEDAAVDLDLS